MSSFNLLKKEKRKSAGKKKNHPLHTGGNRKY